MRSDNYYSDTYGSSKRGGTPLLWIVVRVIFFMVSILAAVALLLTLLAPYVSPHVWWGFPVLGLVAPAVYMFNLIIALVLIVRWRWGFALPIIVLLLLGSGSVSRFVKVDIGKHYDTNNYRGTIKIMSYNLRLHIRDDKQRSTKDISRYLDSLSPDIFCAQEQIDNLFEKELPTKFKRYHKAVSAGVAIYSKYPIIARSEDIIPSGEKGEQSYSMWADLKIGGDTLRVFNNHLTSTTITNMDDRFLTSRKIITDSLREDKIVDIISRFKNSSIQRARHADSIKRIINSTPHHVIVCGDFNDTPMSYVYQSLSRGLKDSFEECGVGYPHTYRGFMNTLRIDYILGSEGVAFKSYNIDRDVKLSDHHPVMVRFTLN